MNHKVIKNIPKKNMVIMEKSSPYKKQIGGNHYSKFKVQPSKFINDNKLLFAEGNAIKYICRHSYKNGKEDLKKAIHYIEMIIERDYS
jgi:hypothetical protein